MPIITYYLSNGHSFQFRKPEDDFERMRDRAAEFMATGQCFVEEQVMSLRDGGRSHRVAALIPASALAAVVIEDPIVDRHGPEFASQHVEVS